MDRKDFLKHACGLGACSCAVAALFASAATEAAEETAPAQPEDEQLTFARRRYAALIGAVAAHTDATTTAAILEEVGRACATTVPFVAAFAGNPEGFIAEIRKVWHAEVSYDAEHRVVDLAFPPTSDCYCPLLRKAVTPAVACTCSLGWQKQAFGTVFGRPVTAEIKESVLRGGARCAFRVSAA